MSIPHPIPPHPIPSASSVLLWWLRRRCTHTTNTKYPRVPNPPAFYGMNEHIRYDTGPARYKHRHKHKHKHNHKHRTYRHDYVCSLVRDNNCPPPPISRRDTHQNIALLHPELHPERPTLQYRHCCTPHHKYRTTESPHARQNNHPPPPPYKQQKHTQTHPIPPSRVHHSTLTSPTRSPPIPAPYWLPPPRAVII